jgi:hypothetical protein
MDTTLQHSSLDSTLDPCYTVLFDNGTLASIPLPEMASIIPKPPVIDELTLADDSSLLFPFLKLNSKIAYEHKGQFQKGYLSNVNVIYQFSFKSHVNKKKEDWGFPLPNLPTNWVDLCVEGNLVPGRVPHSFLCSPTSPQGSTFDSVAALGLMANLK